MYLQSVLLTGGNEQTREDQLKVILENLGVKRNQTNLNIVTLAPDEEKMTLGIEKIRELRQILATKSTTNQPKIAIIYHAEALTEEAQNALLKTLEEPPDNTYLILLAQNSSSLLPTILSRCQIIELTENTKADLTEKEIKEFSTVLGWIEKGNLTQGFAWAKENTDRQSAINTINKLLIIAHQRLLQGESLQIASVQSIFEAKKYLTANTNVRLTLENLFLN